MTATSLTLRRVWRSLDADVDSDGICDDEDPCVGELDECVCNGPGEIYECGCADILKATATATATSLTLWATAAVLVTRMSTQMPSVTTKTLVSENSTNVACATVWRDLRRLCGHH